MKALIGMLSIAILLSSNAAMARVPCEKMAERVQYYLGEAKQAQAELDQIRATLIAKYGESQLNDRLTAEERETLESAKAANSKAALNLDFVNAQYEQVCSI